MIIIAISIHLDEISFMLFKDFKLKGEIYCLLQALGIRRDDQFSTTMLSSVIETLMSEMDPCEGTTDFMINWNNHRNRIYIIKCNPWTK